MQLLLVKHLQNSQLLSLFAFLLLRLPPVLSVFHWPVFNLPNNFRILFSSLFVPEDFLQACSSIYHRLISSAHSPREAVYIPSETSPRQEKKQPPRPVEQASLDGVDSRQFLEALGKECINAAYRWVITHSLPVITCQQPLPNHHLPLE